MTDNERAVRIRCADACRRGDVDSFEACLKAGVDLHANDPVSGRSWLYLSIWYPEDTSLLRFLLGAGVPRDAEALVGAACCSKPEFVSTLLDAGADPNDALSRTHESPLHMAASFGFRDGATECVRRLLRSGANPNVHTATRVESGTWATGVYTMGETPLHLAVTFGDEEMVRLLVDAGADMQAEDGYGHTPMVWCARARRSEKHKQVSADRLICILRGHPYDDERFTRFPPLETDEDAVSRLELENSRLRQLLRDHKISDGLE